MLIGLCGLQGSGKDTIANYLVTEKGFIKLSFASLLKDVVSTVFGWDRELLEGVTEESRTFRETTDASWSQSLAIEGYTPRKALQDVGEALRSHISPQIWIAALERKVKKLLQMNANVVISDVRNMLESCFIVRLNGQVIRVTRNRPTWVKDDNSVDIEEARRLNVHTTELSVFECLVDHDIDNQDDIGSLHNKVAQLISNATSNEFVGTPDPELRRRAVMYYHLRKLLGVRPFSLTFRNTRVLLIIDTIYRSTDLVRYQE